MRRTLSVLQNRIHKINVLRGKVQVLQGLVLELVEGLSHGLLIGALIFANELLVHLQSELAAINELLHALLEHRDLRGAEILSVCEEDLHNGEGASIHL